MAAKEVDFDSLLIDAANKWEKVRRLKEVWAPRTCATTPMHRDARVSRGS